MNSVDARVFLAANAPSDVEEWFADAFNAGHEKMPVLPEGAKWCEGCKGDCEDCDGSESCKAMQEFQRRGAEWRERKDKTMKLQWRWAWADAMLAESQTVKPEHTAPWEDFCEVLSALVKIVENHHLVGGWSTKGADREPVRALSDCEVHPSFIEHARQLLVKFGRLGDGEEEKS